MTTKDELKSAITPKTEAVQSNDTKQVQSAEPKAVQPADTPPEVQTEPVTAAQPATTQPQPPIQPVTTESPVQPTTEAATKPVQAIDWDKKQKEMGWTPSQRIYEQAKYNRENNLPRMSAMEMASILKGRDPYDTEQQRKKKERADIYSKVFYGAGSILNNLMNYVRTRGGNPSYDTSQADALARTNIAKIDADRKNLIANHYNTFLKAYGDDAAQGYKEEQLNNARLQQLYRAQKDKAEREYRAQKDKRDLDYKTDRDKMQKDLEEKKFNEGKRHNQTIERISQTRALNAGRRSSGGGSSSGSGKNTVKFINDAGEFIIPKDNIKSIYAIIPDQYRIKKPKENKFSLNNDNAEPAEYQDSALIRSIQDAVSNGYIIPKTYRSNTVYYPGHEPKAQKPKLAPKAQPKPATKTNTPKKKASSLWQ